MNTPLVSICCITYNQEKFIEECLNSFIMQKVNFPIEIVISNDCSTDSTQNIIDEFKSKYHNLIRDVSPKNNIGVVNNFWNAFNSCKGKYIALCEGDDFWTDENKLQKQVDFLEANPDFTLCFHSVRVFYEDGSKPDYYYPRFDQIENRTEFDFNDLIKQNFIQTNSVVYRSLRDKVEEVYDISEQLLPLDWFMHLLHANHGKIKYFSDAMSCYRKNIQGIWSSDYEWKYAYERLNFFKTSKKIFDKKYHNLLDESILWIYRKLKIDSVTKKDFSKIAQIANRYPEDLTYFVEENTVDATRYIENFRLLDRLLKIKESGLSISSYLKKNGINSIGIYGLGIVAKHFLKEINQDFVKISYFLDKKNIEFQKDIVTITDYDKIPYADAIIITPTFDIESITHMLSEKTDIKLISLRFLLDSVLEEARL